VLSVLDLLDLLWCGVVCVCGDEDDDDDEGYMNLPIIRVFRGEEAGYNVEVCPICVCEGGSGGDDGDDIGDRVLYV